MSIYLTDKEIQNQYLCQLNANLIIENENNVDQKKIDRLIFKTEKYFQSLNDFFTAEKELLEKFNVRPSDLLINQEELERIKNNPKTISELNIVQAKDSLEYKKLCDSGKTANTALEIIQSLNKEGYYLKAL